MTAIETCFPVRVSIGFARSTLALLVRPLSGPESAVLTMIVSILAAIAVLIGFIVARRVWRGRLFHRTEIRTQAIRGDWDRIVSGDAPASTWYFGALDHQIIEAMLLDRLDVAGPDETRHLQDCIRRCGLLDKRSREVRRTRGWRRRQAILALGRMQIADGIPALAEAIQDENEETAIDAMRALGRIATPEAARPIIERLSALEQAAFRCSSATLQTAVVGCYRGHADRLLADLGPIEGDLRAVLARALAEVATPSLRGDLLGLVTDDLAEVRASSARALAVARPPYALDALIELARDPEWFVRLRAVVALGELRDIRGVPTLVERLCDNHRLVRLRAASALVGVRGKETWILRMALGTKDPYALQALISELQRSGRVTEMVGGLIDPDRHAAARNALTEILRAGAERLLFDLALHHPDRRARRHLSRLLVDCRDSRLLALIREQIDQRHLTRSELRIARVIAARLDAHLHSPAPEAIHT